MKTKKIFSILLCGTMFAFAACEKNPPVDENPDGDGTQTEQPALPDFNGHAYVDLGLPSGTLWATCNVGANSPEEYGDYYAWGETTTKSSYKWSTYKWCNYDATENHVAFTKYWVGYNSTSHSGTVDNKTVLDPEDDAAAVNWGGDWRMPTLDEIKELNNNCTTEWTTDYNGTGVAGRIVTSDINGNTIFLPAAGYRNGSSLYGDGAYGIYWSSSLYTSSPCYACPLYFDSVSYDRASSSYRCNGQSVRAVCSSR